MDFTSKGAEKAASDLDNVAAKITNVGNAMQTAASKGNSLASLSRNMATGAKVVGSSSGTGGSGSGSGGSIFTGATGRVVSPIISGVTGKVISQIPMGQIVNRLIPGGAAGLAKKAVDTVVQSAVGAAIIKTAAKGAGYVASTAAGAAITRWSAGAIAAAAAAAPAAIALGTGAGLVAGAAAVGFGIGAAGAWALGADASDFQAAFDPRYDFNGKRLKEDVPIPVGAFTTRISHDGIEDTKIKWFSKIEGIGGLSLAERRYVRSQYNAMVSGATVSPERTNDLPIELGAQSVGGNIILNRQNTLMMRRAFIKPRQVAF